VATFCNASSPLEATDTAKPERVRNGARLSVMAVSSSTDNMEGLGCMVVSTTFQMFPFISGCFECIIYCAACLHRILLAGGVLAARYRWFKCTCLFLIRLLSGNLLTQQAIILFQQIYCPLQQVLHFPVIAE